MTHTSATRSAIGAELTVVPLPGRLRPWSRLVPAWRVDAFVWVVVVSLLVRCLLAGLLPLTADEAYAVVVSRSHALSYYDHPPLAFALARLMADISGTESAMVLRLPFLVMGTGSLFLMHDITRRSFGDRAAFWAAAAFACSPFFLSAGGFLIVPDVPLDFFMLLCIWAIQPMLSGSRGSWRAWLLAGVSLALAMASKYHSVLFGAAALMALAMHPDGRQLLRRPMAWGATAVALTGALPALVWNAQHHWASFAFQSARTYGSDDVAAHLKNLMAVLAGQALYVLPLAWYAAQRETLRSLLRPSTLMHSLLAWLAVLPIAVFDVVAVLGHHSLPHWSMSGFLFALPLVGEARARLDGPQAQNLRRRFTVAMACVGLISLLAAVEGRTGLVASKVSQASGKASGSWQDMSWSAVAPELGAARYIVAPGWVAGGQVGLAAGRGYAIDVPSDPHHFQFMDGRPVSGEKGYYVAPAGLGPIKESYLADLASQQYAVTGPARFVTQSQLAGPAFRIVIIPVVRR